MRCNFTGRPGGLPFAAHCPCNLQQRCSNGALSRRQARLCRLQCDAAAPPEGSGAGGGGASSSSRITPRTQPLKQALPGYVTTSDDQQQQQQQQQINNGCSSGTSSSGSAGLTGQSQPASTLRSLERGGWDWWTAYFNAMDDTVRELDGVDEELSTAVEEEDYGKAAALRLHQKRLENADCVATILQEMQLAIEEERYDDAAALRDAGGARLLGWWAGKAEVDDHQGHLIHVSADFGRYVAHAYTGTNLAELAGLTDDIGGTRGSSSTVSFSTSDLGFSGSGDSIIGPARESLGEDTDPGAPVFEVFIRNDPDTPSKYIQQAAALHAPASALGSPVGIEDLAELLARQAGDDASVSIERGVDEDGTGYVRINVVGVDVKKDDDDDESDFQNMASSSSNTNEEDDELKEAQAFADTINAQLELDGEDESEETIHTIEDLMKIFEEQEKAEEEEEHENSVLAESLDGLETTTPADEMVDAWVEIDGRLKKMRLEEVVANAVGAAAAAAAVDDGVGDDDEHTGEIDVSVIEIGDTLSEMGLGAVAQRVPATIEWTGRDAFTFVVAEDLQLFEEGKEDEAEEDTAKMKKKEKLGLKLVEAKVQMGDQVLLDFKKEKNSKEKDDIEALATQEEAEEKEVEEEIDDTNEATAAKKFGMRPAFSGRLDEIDSIVRSAMGQAIAEGIGATTSPSIDSGILGLSGRINYNRLDLNDPPTDVFSGIYLGTFGPHGPEVLRMSRTTIEGEQWVQATKITGDPNVPAGKVSFRARIGMQHRLSPSGAYPPEYGVQQRYKGQGRVAREGYAAAKWVDGELLTFSAANPMTRGAEIGFVFNMDASKKFLLLFTKVKLDKILPHYN